MSEAALLEVKDLSVTFGTGDNAVRAVRGVSFTLRRGEAVGIVGESGSLELVLEGRVVGIADYRDVGDHLVFPHTEIERALRGQGLGNQLIKGALDDVRRLGRTVVPSCWAVVDFIGANPEYADLVAPRSLAAIQDACVEARRAEPALGSPFDCFAKGMNFDYVIPLGPIVAKYFALAIGPMLAAFVLWFVGAWIMAGFYRRRTKR